MMRAFLVLVYGGLIFSAAGQDVATLEEGLRGKAAALNPEYLVFSPEGVEKEKAVPLLIYLHGAGGVGDQIRKIRGQAQSLWKGIEKFGKGPCIVVAPQALRRSRQKGGWIPGELDVLLDHLKATLPIDEKRVYLTGNSMGGYGTWVWGATSPEHFAAVAPVSGGTGRGGPKDVTPELEAWAKSLATVPVYAFVGAKDKVVPAERSETLVAAIRKAGGERVKLKVYPEQGHGARGVVYSTGEFYEWMFSQVRE